MVYRTSHFAQAWGRKVNLAYLASPQKRSQTCYFCWGGISRCRQSFGPFALSQHWAVPWPWLWGVWVVWKDNRPLGFCCRARQKCLELLASLIHSPVVQVEKHCNYNCHPQSVWEFFTRFKEKIANLRSQHSSSKNLQENEYPKLQGEYIILLVGSSVGLWFVLHGTYALLGYAFKEAQGKMENYNTVFSGVVVVVCDITWL